MIEIMLTIALVLFAIAIGIALLRIILGPSMPDRVLALDVIGVNLISSIAVISIVDEYESFFRSHSYFRDSCLLSGQLHFQSLSRGVLSLNVSAIGEFVGALLILMGGIMSVISVFG